MKKYYVDCLEQVRYSYMFDDIKFEHCLITISNIVTIQGKSATDSLHLNFGDITPETPKKYMGDSALISNEDIEKIIKFVMKYKDKNFIVSCDGGISRSPAVACAIAYILGDYEEKEELEQRYRFINKFIYESIITQWEEKWRNKYA